MKRYKLHTGDNREVLKTFADNSVDSIVTDPPYELGFMGKKWDASGIAYDVTLWAECLRVLKPGGHLLAFGGSRTYHRLAVAIEDAGFEIRDCIMWLYASGFPKSHDVSKALDKQAGAEREVVKVVRKTHMSTTSTNDGWARPSHYDDEGNAKTTMQITAPATPLAQQWQGWGTALKPATETIVVARKPLQGTVADNVTTWGVGALNIDGCRIPSDDGFEKAWDKPVRTNISNGSAAFDTGKSAERGTHAVDISANKPTGGRWPANIIFDEEAAQMLDEQSGGASRFFYIPKASRAEREAGLDSTCTVKYNIDRSILGGLSWNDVGMATVQLLQKVTSELETLKWHIGESGESITVLYPKDSSFITSMEISKITALKTCNLLMHLLTSESTVDVNYEMEYGSSLAKNAEQLKAWILNITNGKMELARGVVSVALITLQKISESEPNARNNHHSTVKPIALMRYLVRLVTPRGGVVLDPFMGSGTTGCAAMLEGMQFIGIELNQEYSDIAERRIRHWMAQNMMGI